MKTLIHKMDLKKLLSGWFFTLYPLIVLFQWSKAGVMLLTLVSALQVTITIGSMFYIAAITEAGVNSDTLWQVLIAVILLLSLSQLFDSFINAFSRVVASDVEKFNEEKVLRLAAGNMSQVEFEKPDTQNFFNSVRGREMGGMMVRQFVMAAMQVFSIRLTGLVALAASALISWYIPLLIIPSLVAIRLWLKAETRILGESFQQSGEAMRRSAYYRQLLLDKNATAELAVFGKRSYIKDQFFNAWLGAMQKVWESRRGRRAKVLLVGIIVAASIGLALGVQVKLALAGAISLANVVFLAQIIPAIIPIAFSGHGEIIIAQGGDIMRQLASYANPDKSETCFKQNIVNKGFATVTLQNICFRYAEASTNTLNKINLEIKRGETIGIVGSNGAGKSTLIKTLVGLYDLDQGEILYDNRIKVDTSSNSWKSVVEYVPQKTSIIPGTVRQIVSRFEPSPNDAEVLQALGRVGADSFVNKLPEGLDTYVGDQGFSGGQDQLLALAQAFYKKNRNQKIYVFDEPTAALSSAREKEIFDLLLNSRQQGEQDSLILVSHRLGGVRRADKIVVLDQGCIVECGSHETLMQNPKSLYRKMYEQQSEPYLENKTAQLRNAV